MNRASAQRARGMTIRRRLLLILIGPLALLLAIGVVLDYAAGVVPLRAAFDQALINETLAAAAQLRARSGGTVEFDLPPQAIEMLRADKYDTVYYLVLGPHDEYVAGFALLNAMGRAEARDLGLDGGALYDPAANYNRVKGWIGDWSEQPKYAPKGTHTTGPTPTDPDVTPYNPDDGNGTVTPPQQ